MIVSGLVTAQGRKERERDECSEDPGEGEEDGTTTDEENAGLIRRRRHSPSWHRTPTRGRGQPARTQRRRQLHRPSARIKGGGSKQLPPNCSSSTRAGNLAGPDSEVTSICAIALRMLRGASATEPTAEASSGPDVTPSTTGEQYSSVASMRVRRGEKLTNEEFATDLSIVRNLVERGLSELHEPMPAGVSQTSLTGVASRCWTTSSSRCWGENASGTHCPGGTHYKTCWHRRPSWWTDEKRPFSRNGQPRHILRM